MINRVGKGFVEGDIIEFNEQSEPLYLYTRGELVKITPQELNELNNYYMDKSERGECLYCFRNNVKFVHIKKV